MARPRKIQPSPFNGLSLDEWQSSPQLVEWARKDATFSNVLCVIQNGFASLPTEEFQGYKRALNVLLGLRLSATPPPQLPEADYRTPAEGMEGDDE